MSTEILAPLCASVPLHNALRAKKYILFQKLNLILKDYSLFNADEKTEVSRIQAAAYLLAVKQEWIPFSLRMPGATAQNSKERWGTQKKPKEPKGTLSKFKEP